MRRLPFFLAALLMATSLSPRQGAHAQIRDPCGSRPCIQVGTFNIEWLGTSSKHKPRPQRVLGQLADLIAETLDLEVVVLEEINTASAEYRTLGRELGRHGYRLHQAGDTAQQDVAIAFDADEVRLLGEISEMDVRSDFSLADNCRSKNLRRPLLAHFRAGRFDFAVVGVHLKSQLDVQGADDPEGCADEIRGQQAGDISRALDGLLQGLGEQDVIVTGDFNATLEDGSLSPLFNSARLQPLTAMGRRARDSGTYSYIPKRYRSLIDHVMVRPGRTREWVSRSTFVMNAPTDEEALANYLEWFSDHLPVWASFRTDGADDD